MQPEEYDDGFLRKYINDKGLKEVTQNDMLDQLTKARWIRNRYDVEVLIASDLGREAKNLNEVVKYYLFICASKHNKAGA